MAFSPAADEISCSSTSLLLSALLLPCFNFSLLIGRDWYLILTLMYIFLITWCWEPCNPLIWHRYICSDVDVQIFCPFLHLDCFLISEFWEFFIYIQNMIFCVFAFNWLCDLNTVSPHLWLVFILLALCLVEEKFLIRKSLICQGFLLWSRLWCHIKTQHHHIRCTMDFHLCFLRESYSFLLYMQVCNPFWIHFCIKFDLRLFIYIE